MSIKLIFSAKQAQVIEGLGDDHRVLTASDDQGAEVVYTQACASDAEIGRLRDNFGDVEIVAEVSELRDVKSLPSRTQFPELK